MKTSLLLLLLCTFNISQSSIDKLIGKWKLEGIYVDKDALIRADNYFLTITKTKISYSLGCNTCTQKIISIDDSIITLDSACGCTKKMCASKKQMIDAYLDFHGKYKVTDSTLVIMNESGNLVLKRE